MLKSLINHNLSLGLLYALPFAPVWAQNSQRGHVSARVTIEPAEVKPGARALLKLTLKLASDAHINSNEPKDENLIPTTFIPRKTAGIVWGTPQYPRPIEVTEWYSIDPLVVFADGAVITIPLTVDPAAAGPLELSGTLVAQACDHEQCYPAERLMIIAPLSLAGTAQDPAKIVQIEAPAKKKNESAVLTQTDAVDFIFNDFDGKERKLSEYRGKVVLLDLWATWCGPCLADFPHLKELYTKHRSSGFEIIGLDCETLGDDAADPAAINMGIKQARTVMARFGTTWVMAEPRSAVAVASQLFRAESLPTKILIDRQGKIVKAVKSRAELEETLVRLLKQP